MPQLVSLVVHDPGRVDDVVRAWLGAGVTGMTLLDSSGLGRHMREHELRDDLPLFPSIRKVLEGEERHSRLLFSIVPDDFDLEALIAATERVLGPLDEPDTGILFVLPVSRVVGLQPSRREAGRKPAGRREGR